MPKPRRELPRRFYKAVDVVAIDGGHGVALDGKPVFTPLRARLTLPWQALAVDIAAEWQAQQEHIQPNTMPLTRLANTALDAVARERRPTTDEIVKFAGSDMLFYRADGPERLIARQTEVWDPVIAWADQIAGARFVLAEGIIHVAQSDQALSGIRREVAKFADFPLAALHVATTLTGSAILALALAMRRLDADEAWSAAHIDEDWQISQWGEDAEAAERRAHRARDFAAAARVLELAAEADC